jgi:hypothetical protein
VTSTVAAEQEDRHDFMADACRQDRATQLRFKDNDHAQVHLATDWPSVHDRAIT